MIAIIPAHAGSKRLPGKNTMKLRDGLNPWWRAVRFAETAPTIDIQPVVTTDIKSVLDKCRDRGVRCIHRPSELCTDDARMEDVIHHVLGCTTESGAAVDTFLLLQPTSPIRSHRTLEDALRLLDDAPCVITTDPWGRRNGNMFLCRIPYFRKFEFGGPSVCHLPMPADHSLDIDTIDDLRALHQVEREIFSGPFC